MKPDLDNNPEYCLESIPMIYFTLALISVAYEIVAGIILLKAYFFLLFFLIILLFSTDILRVLLKNFLGNFGGVCLLGFLFYYVIMAVGYPDPLVSSDHLYRITRNIIPCFLAGIILFGNIKIRSVHEFPKFSQSIQSILLNTPLIIALLFCLLVLALIVFTFLSVKRTDIFLITKLQDDDINYQLFGQYALLTYISSLTILYYFLKQKNNYYITFCSVIIGLSFLFSVALSLVGSNKELVALVLTLALCVIYAKPKNYLIRQNKIRFKTVFTFLFVLLLCGAAALYISHLELPPLRIFDYQKKINLSENESLVSRIDIFKKTGIEQLSINPLFGNLGAETVVARRGEYIHSIISVQSHLGMMGSLLLLGYLIHRFYHLYNNDGRSVLKMITPPIFFISLVGTFFTWPVLWFLMGCLFAPRKDP